jgi:hypothetical protein
MRVFSDLHPAYGVFGQIGERRIACAKIVDYDPDTYFGESAEDLAVTSLSFHQHRFG